MRRTFYASCARVLVLQACGFRCRSALETRNESLLSWILASALQYGLRITNRHYLSGNPALLPASLASKAGRAEVLAHLPVEVNGIWLCAAEDVGVSVGLEVNWRHMVWEVV